MPDVLIDTDDFRVFYRKGRSDFVWVTFGYWGHTSERPWGNYFADSFDYSMLGFIDKRSLWFAGMEDLIPDVRQILNRYPLRLAMGVSMGGYAAIKFSRSLCLDIIYALVPQFSINPATISDHRYRHNFRADVHADMDIHREEVAGQIYTLADPHYPFDMAQHALIETVAQPTLIPSYYAGHLVAAGYRDKETMGKIVDALLAHDVATLKRVTLEGRKTSVERPLGTLCAAWANHPKTARSILDIYGASIEDNLVQNFLCDLGRDLIDLGNRPAAREAVRVGLAVRPENLEIQLEYSKQLYSVDLHAALVHARIASAKGEPEYITWLEKLEREAA